MKFPSFSLPRLLAVALAFAFAPLASFAQSVLPNAQVGVSYSFQVTTNPPAAAGSVYAATGLPGGLGINASSGLISGTPTTAAVFDGSVSITSSGTTNNYAIRISVTAAANTPSITSGTAASGSVGAALPTYALTASNSPTSFNVGALPSGLTVGGTATAPTITGTPTAAGIYQVALSANNASGTGATTTLTITISAAANTPVISSGLNPASVAVGAALSYQITATNTPTSFLASGLPQGVTLNTNTGLISGTPTVAGTYAVSVTASNASGTGPAATVTFTIGTVPVITSAGSVGGTVGSPFSFGITASNSPTSFNFSGALPAGLTINTSSGLITGTPTAAGSATVTLSANNATGSGPNASLAITIVNSVIVVPPPPFVPPPPVAVIAPGITTQPGSQSVSEGATVSLSVGASGTSPSYQWQKNGTAINGATAATLTLTNVTNADAGTYTVVVSNSAGSLVSNGAILTVTALTLPVITSQPIAQAMNSGGTTTFSVSATGGTPLTYQWRKDGIAISGATSSTLTLTNVSASSAGVYSVVVSNSLGTATSNAVALTIGGRPAGTYFGTFGGNGGTFALLVRADRTGVFLGYVRGAAIALVSRDVVVDANGRFRVTTTSAGGIPAVAAEYVIDGTIAADGALSGTVSGLNLTLSAPASSIGATTSVAGFYQAGAANSSATSYIIIGAAGDAFVVTVIGATADAGKGTVDATGRIDVTTESNARVVATINVPAATISATVTPLGTGGASTFVGANNDARAEVEKLVNISTRSQTGSAANVLIAGFVLTGDQPKSVLIRAVGPTLSQFGVGGVLSAARLEVFRGSTSIAVGNDWGAGANAAMIAATAARVGAFALPANSRDAALLLTLEPGAYTTIVTGQGGVTGVALVEAYDATAGSIPRGQRIINISTRALAGAGDTTLIAGFVITGSVPKRVLVRGVGPSLAQFGLTGVIARPQVAVFSGSTIVAQNAGWSASVDASAIANAGAQVGAFALLANSQDAALIVNLVPGAYTAQIAGVGGASGIALVEVYELP